jgi:Fe-S-cluster containining protein
MSNKCSTVSEDILSRFVCTGCGECCRWPGHVLLRDQDIEELAAYLGLTVRVFVEQYTRLASNRAQLSLRDQEDGSCIFLVDDACSVYGVRPKQCRTFPAAWQVGRGCPELDRLYDEQKRVD